MSGSNLGQTIFQSIWNLLMGFLQNILAAVSGAFTSVFGSFADGLGIMFQSWGYALSGYGIWGPLMTVVSLAIAGMVGYLFLDFMDDEKDVAEDETEA